MGYFRPHLILTTGSGAAVATVVRLLAGGAIQMALRGEGITISYFALDTHNNVGATGDDANHTLKWSEDGTPATPTNSPAELDATNCPGVYTLAITDAEADCEIGLLAGKSSTANVILIPVQVDFAITATGSDVNVVSVDGVTLAAEVMAALYGAGASKATIDDTGATTTVFKTTLPVKAANYFANQAIVFTTGDLAGQSGNVKISLTSGGKTRLQLKAGLTAAPANGVEFILVGRTA